jgi:Na+-driven multidrug efflux pump
MIKTLDKLRNIMSIATPTMLSNLILFGVLLINTRVLGNFKSTYFYYLALFTPINYFMIATYEAFRITSLCLCQACARNQATLLANIKNLMCLAIIIISAITLLYVLCNNNSSYFNITISADREFFWFVISMLIAANFIVFNSIIHGALYALKLQKISLIIIITTSCSLCLLNYILLHNFKVGIFALSIAITCVYSIATSAGYLLLSKKNSEHLKPSYSLTLSWHYFYSLGLPIFSIYIVIFVSLFLYNMILNHFGSEFVSAFSLSFKVQSILMLPAIAIGIATGIITNKLVQTKQQGKALAYLKFAFLLTLIVYLIISCLTHVFATSIANILVAERNIQNTTRECISYLALSYFGLGPTLMFIAILEQTGYVKKSLAINTTIFATQIVCGGTLAILYNTPIYFYKTAILINLLPLLYIVYQIFNNDSYKSRLSKLATI